MFFFVSSCFGLPSTVEFIPTVWNEPVTGKIGQTIFLRSSHSIQIINNGDKAITVYVLYAVGYDAQFNVMHYTVPAHKRITDNVNLQQPAFSQSAKTGHYTSRTALYEAGKVSLEVNKTSEYIIN